MKIGQKMLVIEVGGGLRAQYSNEFWSFHGRILSIIGLNVFGRVVEAINFPKPPLRVNRKNGHEELYFNGIVLVKLRWWQESGFLAQERVEYGVGVFWVNDISSPIAWHQMGHVCLLSDMEGKRYLREFIEYTNK